MPFPVDFLLRRIPFWEVHMEEKLDKDFNPIWLCKTAGLLFPSGILVVSVTSATFHWGSVWGDWLLIGWCSFLVVEFLHRYRSGKVESLFWELLVGAFLAEGPLPLALPSATHTRDWSTVGYFGLTFTLAAFRYLRRFYFPLAARRNGNSVSKLIAKG